jgi:phenylalanyl-tRNA synthetase beta chain
MNISYRWLQELVPGLRCRRRRSPTGSPCSARRWTRSSTWADPLRDIVIGRVVEAQRHPNADRLSLCTVDAGAGDTLQVVCGAPNVKAGAFYPFAPVGARCRAAWTIRKAKIRGEESQGMLCSARELGLGRDHEGILELHGEFEPGRSFIESGRPRRCAAAVDVTPNRPDLLSHSASPARSRRRRAARPAAPAARRRNASCADERCLDTPGTARRGGRHRRRHHRGRRPLPALLGLVIRGVRVGPSPEVAGVAAARHRLRPISNVVDATNFVLHELGQPLHAFDLARLGDGVVVRRARAGERITTLDGVDRKLDAGMLVIADASAAGRHCRRHGRRGHRGAGRHARHPARVRALRSALGARHAARARPEHRRELPLRARRGSGRHGARAAARRAS